MNHINQSKEEEKVCSRCKLTKPTSDFYKRKDRPGGLGSHCKSCDYNRTNTEEMGTWRRNWNKTHRDSLNKALKEYLARNPEKKKAWSKWSKALKNGKIVKKPCVVCGSKSAQGHHKDYSKPLEIVWLCRKHHKDIHYGRITL